MARDFLSIAFDAVKSVYIRRKSLSLAINFYEWTTEVFSHDSSIDISAPTIRKIIMPLTSRPDPKTCYHTPTLPRREFSARKGNVLNASSCWCCCFAVTMGFGVWRIYIFFLLWRSVTGVMLGYSLLDIETAFSDNNNKNKQHFKCQ